MITRTNVTNFIAIIFFLFFFFFFTCLLNWSYAKSRHPDSSTSNNDKLKELARSFSRDSLVNKSVYILNTLLVIGNHLAKHASKLSYLGERSEPQGAAYPVACLSRVYYAQVESLLAG